MAPLTFGSIVIAEDNGAQDNDTTTTSDDSSSTNKRKTLEERLAERKANLEEKLSAVKEARIEARCKNAQGKITSTLSRIKGISTSRAKVHSNLVDRLTKLSDKLKENGVDVTSLESQIAALKTKIQTFKTDLDAHIQELEDLAAMDCKADPAAFQASLEAARNSREKVVADAKAIRDYVKETIKPTLQAIRKDLAEKKAETESNNDDTDESSGGNQ